MRDQILRFLTAIDDALTQELPGERLDLHLIGRAALILFYEAGGGVATRDVDVVLFSSPPTPAMQLALDLFGKDTQAMVIHGLYLESVPSPLPPMAAGYRTRAEAFRLGPWQVTTAYKLEVHDLAISKLKRFAPKDREDLTTLADKGLLLSQTLRDRLESAFLWDMEKDGDPSRDTAFDHLQRLIAYIEGKMPGL